MLRFALILCAAGSALAACGQAPEGARAATLAQGPPPTVAIAASPSPQADAADFVAKISAGNAFELAAAQIAQAKGRSDAVKRFAAEMLRDHGKSAADLKTALAQAGQALIAAPGPAPDQQQVLAQLQSSDPRDFDKAYMDSQVAAHLKALALTQSYAEKGDVTSLAVFAGEAAPVIQGHYEMATQIDQGLN